jgi:hypothetical protein
MRIVRGCSRVCRIAYSVAIPAGFWGGMRCGTARAAEPSGKFQPPTYTFLHTVARAEPWETPHIRVRYASAHRVRLLTSGTAAEGPRRN